jgi:hypothetical protein
MRNIFFTKSFVYFFLTIVFIVNLGASTVFADRSGASRSSFQAAKLSHGPFSMGLAGASTTLGNSMGAENVFGNPAWLGRNYHVSFLSNFKGQSLFGSFDGLGGDFALAIPAKWGKKLSFGFGVSADSYLNKSLPIFNLGGVASFGFAYRLSADKEEELMYKGVTRQGLAEASTIIGLNVKYAYDFYKGGSANGILFDVGAATAVLGILDIGIAIKNIGIGIAPNHSTQKIFASVPDLSFGIATMPDSWGYAGLEFEKNLGDKEPPNVRLGVHIIIDDKYETVRNPSENYEEDLQEELGDIELPGADDAFLFPEDEIPLENNQDELDENNKDELRDLNTNSPEENSKEKNTELDALSLPIDSEDDNQKKDDEDIDQFSFNEATEDDQEPLGDGDIDFSEIERMIDEQSGGDESAESDEIEDIPEIDEEDEFIEPKEPKLLRLITLQAGFESASLSFTTGLFVYFRPIGFHLAFKYPVKKGNNFSFASGIEFKF